MSHSIYPSWTPLVLSNDLQVLPSNEDSVQLTWGIRAFSSSLPRYDFDGKQVEPRFRVDDDSYYQSIMMVGIPFVVVGLGTLVVSWFFAIKAWRKGHVEPFTTSGRISPGVMALCGVLFLLAIGTLVSSGLYHGAFMDFGDEVERTVEAVVRKEDSLMEAVRVANLSALVSKDLQEVWTISHNVANLLNQYHAQLENWEGARLSALGFTMVVTLLACLVALISRRWTGWLRVLIMACGALGLIAWSGVGLHMAGSVFNSDLCEFSDHALMNAIAQPIAKTSGVNASVIYPMVNYFMYCDTSDPFVPLYSGVDYVLQVVEQRLNDSIANGDSNETIAAYQQHLRDLNRIAGGVKEFLNCTYLSQPWRKSTHLLCGRILNVGFIQACFLFAIGVLCIASIAMIIAHISRVKREDTMLIMLTLL